MTEDVIYSKQMFDPRFSELTTKFKVDTCLPMVKLNQMTSLFSAACFNVARLVILIFMIFDTMYNGAVANALVLCVGTNGHIEIELVEGGVASDCFHHQKVSTNKSTVDRFTSLQKTYAFEDLAQHTDLSGKSVALSRRNTDIDVPLFELAEPKFFWLQLCQKDGFQLTKVILFRPWTRRGRVLFLTNSTPLFFAGKSSIFVIFIGNHFPISYYILMDEYRHAIAICQRCRKNFFCII